ncbi:exportin-6-A [Hetaerina americana]|uniref:exportin-6-A n=1 Tax=Hetaerina americana TaxID=62018 RepID=UPI003A7F2F7E
MTSSIDHATLGALESLLEEFFSPGTSAQRRGDIEIRLSDFGSQHQAWKQCLTFAAHSNNPHVAMYCLNVVEGVVARRWVGLEWEERAEARSALHELALSTVCRAGRPPFLGAKVAKVLVGVARHDWPHFYPDFLTNVVQLIRSDGERCLLGLVLLRTASEELVGEGGSGREEVLGSGRREELRRLLLSHLPDIISLLTDLLEASVIALTAEQDERRPNPVWEGVFLPDMEGATVTATPPPSPTVPAGDDSADERQRPSKGTVARATHILEALAHLLSWAPPLPQCLRPELLTPLFALARLDTSGRGVGALGTLAMGAVNEVLYRQCLPLDGGPFILAIVEGALALLEEALGPPPGGTALRAALSDLEDRFPDRLTETVRLLVAQHLSRLEAPCPGGNPLVARLLPPLFALTFTQAPVERFLSCLDVWADLAERKSEGCGADVRLYEGALLGLVERILWRIQFRNNWRELEDIDSETVDDDGQTQWEHYLGRCIEVVARVGELFPDGTLGLIGEAWSGCAESYIQGHTMSSSSSGSSDHHHLRRDLASLTLAVGRAASLGALSRPPLMNDGASRLESRASELVSRLVSLASRGIQRSPVPPADLVEVHAQTLAALQAWCHWMAQRIGPTGDSRAAELVSQSAACAVNGIMAGAEWNSGRAAIGKAGRVPHAAAHLFCTLTAVARPPRLWQNPAVSPLFSRGRDVLLALPEETGHLVARGLQNSLLLAQAGEGTSLEGPWAEREALYGSLLSSLVDQESLGALGSQQNADYARVGVAVKAWRLLADQLENGRGMGGRSKRALHACLVPHLDLALRLLPHLTGHPGACEAGLGLFRAALSVLTPRLLGTSFSSSLLDALLGPDSLRAALGATSTPHGAALVVRFLQLLQLVVVEPGRTFERFVPTAISLCTDHIHPLLEQNPSPDVSAALLDVLSDALFHQWHRFFVPRSVRDGSVNGNADDVESVPEGRVHFLASMRVFGHALLGEDIALFGRALAALLRLHEKWGLFQKALFRREVMPPLVSALLWVGVASRGPPSLLHADDLASVLGALHSSDPCTFRSAFLPNFLSDPRLGLTPTQVASLADDFTSVVGQQVDHNSFSRALIRLGEDLRCHRLCNAVVPGGGINL